MLAKEENFAGLARIKSELIGRAEALNSPSHVVLDVDSTEIPVYGQQEQSAYNDHFESTYYHARLFFNREGSCLAANTTPRQRPQHRWLGRTAVAGDRAATEAGQGGTRSADAAFAKPEVSEAPEKRGVKQAIRIPANDSLERDVAEVLTRPVGRPSRKPVVRYKSSVYQAASWKTAGRVVAKVEFHGKARWRGSKRDQGRSGRGSE